MMRTYVRNMDAFDLLALLIGVSSFLIALWALGFNRLGLILLVHCGVFVIAIGLHIAQKLLHANKRKSS